MGRVIEYDDDRIQEKRFRSASDGVSVTLLKFRHDSSFTGKSLRKDVKACAAQSVGNGFQKDIQWHFSFAE